MSPPADAGPPPSPGDVLYIDNVLGGPWQSMAMALSGETLTIAAPRRGGTPVTLASGRELLLGYSVRSVPCEVDAIWVDGPRELAGEQIVVVRLAGVPRRMQRREAVRVPVNLVVRAQAIGDGDGAPAWSAAAVTENLSAGGALLRLAEPVGVGTEIVVMIAPPTEGDPMEMVGRVVRCDRDPSGARPWRIGLAFVTATSDQQERLVRYIFRLQREERARESGMAP